MDNLEIRSTIKIIQLVRQVLDKVSAIEKDQKEIKKDIREIKKFINSLDE